MTDALDIESRIDSSFGDGPAAPSLDLLLAEGHRALRRRRMVTGVAGLAVAIVVGGSALAVNGNGNEPDARSPYVTEPTTQTPDPDPWQVVPASNPAIEGTELVGWDNDGGLLVRQGVQVLEYVDNPLEKSAPDRSAGLAVRVDGAEKWLITDYEVDAGGGRSSGTSSEEARLSFPTFALWLDDQMAMRHGEPTLALVRFGDDGLLEPLAGVTLIRQLADPDIGPAFADEGEETAVAEVRWEGERWYVLARKSGNGGPEYFPTAASVSARTLEEFIPYAHDAYTGGGGLR